MMIIIITITMIQFDRARGVSFIYKNSKGP